MIVERNASNYFQLNFLKQFIIEHDGFIAGGCFKNLFNGEKIKDIDIFFVSENDFDGAVAYFEAYDDYIPYYENANVKAFKHIKTGIAIELCRKIFGTPKQILEQFDFTIAKFAFFIKSRNRTLNIDDPIDIQYGVLCDDMFFEHLKLQRIVIDNLIPYPMSTFERMIKYVRYGFMPCKETKMKIAMALHDMDAEAILVSESLYNGLD